MTSEQFVMWLQGFFEGRTQENGKISVEAEHMTMIAENLSAVDVVQSSQMQRQYAAPPVTLDPLLMQRAFKGDVKKDAP